MFRVTVPAGDRRSFEQLAVQRVCVTQLGGNIGVTGLATVCQRRRFPRRGVALATVVADGSVRRDPANALARPRI